ncbi:S9 family peptidase [Salinicoccus hispanicus]|uniref:Acyl-peptide hydrolase n=1 Tax=Salinicoccus hispanicus TaxID=157225 RepID=A0A6N8U6H1_9STAP|nr:alpha/beta fold hydrolase [Salinicoccus hispanicus]MXQ51219.1 alpha/beta fold hydrolase [Salinicoccus hispanicus]
MIEFPKPTVEQFFTSYNINNFTVSPDEKKILFSTNLNGKVNIWAMDTADTYPYLFAQKDESTNFIKYDPKSRYVLAGYDHDGDENYQIYATGPEGGVPKPLITGEADEKYFFAKLSQDGTKVYYMTSKGNESFLNTLVFDIETGEERTLHEGERGPTYLADVSIDEKNTAHLQLLANTYILGFVKTPSGVDFITPDPDVVHTVGGLTFVKDDEIWFSTDYESEYNYLAKYNLENKEFSKVMDFGYESLTDLQFNRDTNMLYLTTEKGVVDKLYYYDLNHDLSDEISLPFDSIRQLAAAKSGNLYVLGGSAAEPFNIWKFSQEEWTPLTKNRVLGVTSDDMVEPETIKYTSYDELQIEALLFRAKEENSNGYTIFWPHGGPQAAERKFYRAMFQMFLNRGYNIFCPNFRGSTGYGSSFVKLVEQDWGHGPRLDNVSAIEWLFDNGISSPEKLFLVGGSYGGYMALLLHGRHPEYFKAVVDIFGVSNLFTFYNSVPDHWKPIMERWIGDPQKDKERFEKDSPITYLDTMAKPMLVIQGAKDPRVVKEESDQIVEELRGAGREIDYLVLDDEGHGFSKKKNEIKVYKTMLEFLEKHQ